jgi:hypothetical protein
MDKKRKKESLCYQVLFNKPLLITKDKYIYGFRLKEEDIRKTTFSERLLQEYVVEGIFGKCLFETIHHGSFEDEEGLNEIWIDLNGNKYKYDKQTRLYCYDATVANMMNYRCDLVYATCETKDDFGNNYWIIDPNDYFEWKSMMDIDDHKLGKNQWLENYNKILSRWKVLSKVISNRSENLDYDMQELIKKEWFDAKL